MPTAAANFPSSSIPSHRYFDRHWLAVDVLLGGECDPTCADVLAPEPDDIRPARPSVEKQRHMQFSPSAGPCRKAATWLGRALSIAPRRPLSGCLLSCYSLLCGTS